MNLNSNRLRTQEYFEQLLGCSDPSELKLYQSKAANIEIGVRQAEKFRKFCEEDCRNFLYKGMFCILSGVSNLAKGQQTWPVVQFYYATYYLLRAELLMRNRCILRANQVFTILCRNGERVEKVSNRNAKSDHDLTIKFSKKYLDHTDILLSQKIDDTLPYEWLMEQRNKYQYKQRRYIEFGGKGPFFPFDEMDLLNQVNLFLSDPDPYFCFDPDYAILALPIKRLQLTLKNAKDHSLAFDKGARKTFDSFGLENTACARLISLIRA